MYSSKLAVVEVTEGFLSCQAVENVKSGSFLTDLWGPVFDLPTAYTVQVEKKQACMSSRGTGVFQSFLST